MDENIYDVAIVGCGPAGLSAAINAKIRNKSLIVFGSNLCSPRISKAPRFDNYLGFIAIKGDDLRKEFLKHIDHMGIGITEEKVDNIFPMGEVFGITTKGGGIYKAKTIIISNGITNAQYFKGEQELLGKGVSYCATCDGPLYKDKTVALVGYTPEGEGEVNFLAEICKKVYYIPMYKNEGRVKEQVEILNKEPKAIIGENKVAQIEFEDQNLDVEGVFIIREVTPLEQLIPGLEMESNAVKVNRDMSTNIPGIFAAGDCTGKPWQLPKAVGEGQVAAFAAVKYLDEMGRKH